MVKLLIVNKAGKDVIPGGLNVAGVRDWLTPILPHEECIELIVAINQSTR